MNKALALVALLSIPAFSSAVSNDYLPEDRTELTRLEAELKTEEQQLSRTHQKIAQLRERISRHESAACVRSAESVKRSYKKGSSEE